MDVSGLMMTKSRIKTGARSLSWVFGLAMLVAVVVFAAHHSEGMAFARLLLRVRPVWLLLALLLQMATYLTEAAI